MTKLYFSPRSPFARRIRLALARLQHSFTTVELNVFEPTPDFLKTNPLATVPVLITTDNNVIPDSAAILEYLHEQHGGKIWPAEPAKKIQVRALATWAEGLMTATVAHFLESLRSTADREVLAEYELNIERTLQRIATMPNTSLLFDGTSLTQAGWDLAVALEYLDLRLAIKFEALKQAPPCQTVMKLARSSPEFVQTAPPPAS